MKESFLKKIKEHWDELLKEGQTLKFGKGQVLFYEGHNPYGLFVIKSGKVRFTKDGKLCRGNHLWLTSKGDVVGFDSFFDGVPYCCTCTSQDCQVVFVSKTQLLPYMTSVS